MAIALRIVPSMRCVLLSEKIFFIFEEVCAIVLIPEHGWKRGNSSSVRCTHDERARNYSSIRVVVTEYPLLRNGDCSRIVPSMRCVSLSENIFFVFEDVCAIILIPEYLSDALEYSSPASSAL